MKNSFLLTYIYYNISDAHLAKIFSLLHGLLQCGVHVFFKRLLCSSVSCPGLDVRLLQTSHQQRYYRPTVQTHKLCSSRRKSTVEMFQCEKAILYLEFL
jgi:hypothetical protein